VADRFASVGYLAIAPALFDRAKKGFDVGYDPDARARGMAIAGKLDFEQALRDVAAAIGAAKEAGKVGIVGYCFGGSVAWAAAARLPGLDAAVGYYGGRILAMKDLKPQVPTELHFGEQDPHIPIKQVREFAAEHPELNVFTYPAGHGFNCDQRDSYEAGSAALAWSRTLEFFRRHMG